MRIDSELVHTDGDRGLFQTRRDESQGAAKKRKRKRKGPSMEAIRRRLMAIAVEAGSAGFFAAQATAKLRDSHVQTVRGCLSQLVHDGKLRVEEGHKNESGHAVKKYYEVVLIPEMPVQKLRPVSYMQRVALGSFVV